MRLLGVRPEEVSILDLEGVALWLPSFPVDRIYPDGLVPLLGRPGGARHC